MKSWSFNARSRSTAIACLLAVSATLSVADPLPEHLRPIVESVSVLPHDSPRLRDMSSEARQQFAAALTLSDGEIDQLRNSDDPRAIGLAIEIAHYRGNVSMLLGWRMLLADERETIPQAVPRVSVFADRTTRPITVAGLLSSVYGYWFGNSAPYGAARFNSEFADHVTDAERLVNPWLVRLDRAQAGTWDDDPTSLALRDQIASLDPALRWAIVAQAHKEDRYTDAQAAAVYQSLPPDIRANIENGVRMLSFDPAYSFSESALAREDELQLYARGILELADSLPVNPPPDPDPPPDPPPSP